jgi:hypothetical protein
MSGIHSSLMITQPFIGIGHEEAILIYLTLTGLVPILKYFSGLGILFKK